MAIYRLDMIREDILKQIDEELDMIREDILKQIDEELDILHNIYYT